MPVPKAILKLAVPSVLACLVMVLYNLADTYFVGMLNDAIETSAVTLAAPVLLAFNAVNNLFGIGCASKISRALGEKDEKTVRITSSLGFWGAVCSGVLFSVLCFGAKPLLLRILGTDGTTAAATERYLFWTVFLGAAPSILNVVMGQIVKADGSALHAAVGTMSGCLLNVILDPIFILPWGFGMGAAGAGCATFLSNCFACLYFIILLWIRRKKTYISVHPKYCKPTRAIIKDVCGVGIPSAVQNLLNVTGMTVLNNFMSVYGDEAVAAAGISHKTAMIPLYIAMGISQGIMPLVGYNFTAGNRKRMRDAVVFTAKLSLVLMLAATAAYLAFAGPITRLFMENEGVVTYGTSFLRAMAAAQPFLCIDFLAVGVFQACGLGKKAFVFAILRKVVLEIPAIILLDLLFPMYGIAYSQLCAEVVLAGLAVFELRKLLRIKKEESIKI